MTLCSEYFNLGTEHHLVQSNYLHALDRQSDHWALKWAARRCSPRPRVPQAPFCRLDGHLLLLVLVDEEHVIANGAAALLVVLALRDPSLFHLETHGFYTIAHKYQYTTFVKVVY